VEGNTVAESADATQAQQVVSFGDKKLALNNLFHLQALKN